MLRDRRLLALAIAANLATPEEIQLYARGPDPLADLDADQLVDYAIAHAGSGIWADCPRPTATVNGQVVPAPPGYRRGRGPRGRSPRGKGTAALDAPHTDADDTPATVRPTSNCHTGQ